MKRKFFLLLIIFVLLSLAYIHVAFDLSVYDSYTEFSEEYRPDSGPDTTFPASSQPGYKLEPNTSVSYRTEYAYFQVETNEKGWRDRSFDTKPDKNKFRIAVVGDSVTFGRRVNNSQTWVNQFEEKINRSTERSIEVLNLGSVGEDARDKAETVENWAIEYEPDMLIIQLSQHDEQNRSRIRELETKYLENLSDPGENKRHKAHDYALKREEKERNEMTANESMRIVTESLDRINSETGDIPVVIIGVEMREEQKEVLEAKSENLNWTYYSVPGNVRKIDNIIPEGYLNPDGHKAFAEAVYENLGDLIKGF